MNKVVLMGRLTKNPEVRNNSGIKVVRFTLAVDRHFKRQGDEQTADFISCVSFGKIAEFVEKYLKQGTKIIGSGKIQTGSYTNRNGQKVYTTDVVLEELEFAESKSKNGSSPPEPKEKDMGDGFMEVPKDMDDMPFT